MNDDIEEEKKEEQPEATANSVGEVAPEQDEREIPTPQLVVPQVSSPEDIF